MYKAWAQSTECVDHEVIKALDVYLQQVNAVHAK